jgi:hypothetical protein
VSDSKLKTERARQALPLRRLMEQHGDSAGGPCPFCGGGNAALRRVDGRKITERTIAAVRERTDLVALIERQVPLKKSGAQFTACCPFHQEKTPSFYVSPKKRSFKCFGCEQHGDAFKWLMLRENLKFGEAVEVLARAAGVEIEFEKEDRDEWVCAETSCKAKEGADEAAYLGLKLGVNAKEGWVAWLRAAGVLKSGARVPEQADDFSGRNAPDHEAGTGLDTPDPEPALLPQPASENQRTAGSGATMTVGTPDPVLPWPEGGSVGPDLSRAQPSSNVQQAVGDTGPAPSPTGGEIPCDAPQQRPDGVGPVPPSIAAAVAPKSPLLEFWRRTEWTEADAAAFEVKRGLPAEATRLLGLRANRRTNLKVLEELCAEFGVEAMLGCGLYSKHGIGAEELCRPNRQFYGWGLLGSVERMRRAGQNIPQGAKIDRDGNAWFWTEPVLIPYWEPGVNGERMLVSVRPHKGGAKGQPAHLYVPLAVDGNGYNPDLAAEKFTAVVACESEFKAAAVWWTFRGSRFKIGACGLPGISQGSNDNVRWPLVEWVRSVGARKVVVVFDSEEKGDQTLPGWKANPKKRYDAEAWSRFLAKWLSYQRSDEQETKIEGMVGTLPKAWRDGSGKADWDGVLARMWVQEAVNPLPKVSGQSASVPGRVEIGGGGKVEEGAWRFTSSPRTMERRREIGVEFLKVINEAVAPGEARQTKMFADWEERIIADKLHTLWYDPHLPFGGSREEKIAEKLEWLIEVTSKNGESWLMAPYARGLAAAFRKVAAGWSYDRRAQPIKKEEHLQFFNRERYGLAELIKREPSAEQKKVLRAKVAFYDQFQKGIPNPASNFEIDPIYMLIRRKGEKEEHERMVVLENQMGEKSKPVLLEMEWLDTPSRFKRWVGLRGRFDWMEGEDALEWLRYDVNQGLLGKDVYEVNEIGWHANGKFWMFGDCAIESQASVETPAAVAQPDEYGVVYVDGLGYQLSEADWENQDFKLGKPLMKPALGLRFKASQREGDLDYVLKEHKEDDLAALTDLFGEYVFRMREMIAVPANYDAAIEYDGFLLIGSILSYAAAPEFFKREGYFPGSWVNGERGGGKGYRAGMLMRMWGFDQDAFVSLHGTKVGIAIALQQYCNLPVRLEEAKNLPPDLVELLKGTHNRETPPKFELTGRSRKIHTAPLIVGEHTARDSALAQRFPAVNVSKQRRLRDDGAEVDHKEWFQRHSDLFFCIGRHLLRHRRRYVELTLKHWSEWMQEPALRKTEDRCRGVHGLAFAGFVAAAEIFGVKAELEAFRAWMVKHTEVSSGEVIEQVNVNVVWQHILNAFKGGSFGNCASEYARYFKAVFVKTRHPPGADTQRNGGGGDFSLLPDWRSYTLYFDYRGVWDRLQEHWRHIGENPPMTCNDFRAQMQSHPYFLKPQTNNRSLYQRLSGNKSATPVWGIKLDCHPMGYSPRSDQEVLEAFANAASEDGRESLIRSEDWVDPRKGELFLLCHALEKKEKNT